MTGWSLGGLQESPDRAGKFLFRPAAHEPGPRTIMSKRYPEDGQAQALAVMKDLAASPHTANHIAMKLARHFVADDPPPSLVAKLRKTYLGTGGDLAEVARTIFADFAPGAEVVGCVLAVFEAHDLGQILAQ